NLATNTIKKNVKPKYGDAAFLEYTRLIVNHPNYFGMPDPFGEKGEIQWEAPSNRASGKFKHTHQRRYEWWKNKARSIGIDPDTEKAWISKTAKLIHPLGVKPCKKCGKEMELSYSYPNEHFFSRVRKLNYIDETFELSQNEHIVDLLTRLDDRFGERIYLDLPHLFSTKSITIPDISSNLEAWIEYLKEQYIPQESRMLSPGAMANPPDRFDGFHSFNRCCRSIADKGRTKENLKSYVTDRRVFEYWVDGDWVAADRLMGQVRTNNIFINEECLNAGNGGLHPTPCQADHIGPISLGFSHRPQFQLLCKSCNSAKNNRMYLSDIISLLEAENEGHTVISWFAEEVWNRLKHSVDDSEKALRLSKILRDNRHTYMNLLKKIMDEGYYTFLASLLHLEVANYNPIFEGLCISNHLTHYKSLKKIKRESKYAAVQKTRRIRIAFTSLNDYHRKENRNAFIVSNELSEKFFSEAMDNLKSLSEITSCLDEKISGIISENSDSKNEFRTIITDLREIVTNNKEKFNLILKYLISGMSEIGKELESYWENDRYVRSIPEEFIE
ncbi:TPA: Alw26I/Eco31I/Esp3I family type II restriction endonuclease, partial [Escherichia coli]|nr:Alw26I/Eco31I/Esp3I family type II restriction endonuclease [Escherichia coli]HDV8734592.1 Alw26I/Eco31I/Esp3I family type II restriction endonuclease [Escherichia coli]HEA7456307.1 Alw26I/Eco31I/Esp3I family type II restriction endonuclease [Escherichia coli]HEA9259721.1 Alw26I/Eco31I/Esp3I family type II restriction endonuclease [Escherichia coli]